MQACSSPGCDKQAQNDAVCRSCSDNLFHDLKSIPDLWAELEITRRRLAKTAHEQVGSRSATQPLFWNEEAAQAATDLAAVLNAWALDIHNHGDYSPHDPLAMCILHPAHTAAWLARNFQALLRLEDVGEFTDVLVNAIIRARKVIDRPPDRLFAGRCNTPDQDTGEICREPIYGIPGRETAKCSQCKKQHDLDQRRAAMLANIEDQVAHSGLLSGLVTTLGVPIASSTIRYYASKGRIKVISVDAQRRPLYRIGEVLDVFLKRVPSDL